MSEEFIQETQKEMKSEIINILNNFSRSLFLLGTSFVVLIILGYVVLPKMDFEPWLKIVIYLGVLLILFYLMYSYMKKSFVYMKQKDNLNLVDVGQVDYSLDNYGPFAVIILFFIGLIISSRGELYTSPFYFVMVVIGYGGYYYYKFVYRKEQFENLK